MFKFIFFSSLAFSSLLDADYQWLQKRVKAGLEIAHSDYLEFGDKSLEYAYMCGRLDSYFDCLYHDQFPEDEYDFCHLDSVRMYNLK